MNERVQSHLAPAAAATLERWHAMIAARDLRDIATLLDERIVFRSPMAYGPYTGVATVALILQTVTTIFEEFRYAREFVAGERDVVLEFSAHVGSKQLKGVDLIAFSEAGHILEFEVMIRPASGLLALGERMNVAIGPALIASKAQG